jgi:hypothetical protein
MDEELTSQIDKISMIGSTRRLTRLLSKLGLNNSCPINMVYDPTTKQTNNFYSWPLKEAAVFVNSYLTRKASTTST